MDYYHDRNEVGKTVKPFPVLSEYLHGPGVRSNRQENSKDGGNKSGEIPDSCFLALSEVGKILIIRNQKKPDVDYRKHSHENPEFLPKREEKRECANSGYPCKRRENENKDKQIEGYLSRFLHEFWKKQSSDRKEGNGQQSS